LAEQVEVVGESALTGQQPLILLAADGLADRADRGHGISVDHIVHSPASATLLTWQCPSVTALIARDEPSGASTLQNTVDTSARPVPA
jgi:hypothetical protein